MNRFISLSEFLWLAEQVTGIDADVLARSSRLNLADSALHAPRASFGGQDVFSDLIDKAAVLACHLAWNHPLVYGNKRSSWASLVMFLDLNDVVWDPDPLTSVKRKRQWSPSWRTMWTKRGSPRGSAKAHDPPTATTTGRVQGTTCRQTFAIGRRNPSRTSARRRWHQPVVGRRRIPGGRRPPRCRCPRPRPRRALTCGVPVDACHLCR